MPYRRKCRIDGATTQKARVENVFNSLLPLDASRFTDGCRGSSKEGAAPLVIPVDDAAWRAEFTQHAKWFETLQQNLPSALREAKTAFEQRLSA
jgi:GTP-dependent phosphoenolpyruvate carboxykinase